MENQKKDDTYKYCAIDINPACMCCHYCPKQKTCPMACFDDPHKCRLSQQSLPGSKNHLFEKTSTKIEASNNKIQTKIMSEVKTTIPGTLSIFKDLIESYKEVINSSGKKEIQVLLKATTGAQQLSITTPGISKMYAKIREIKKEVKNNGNIR